MNFIINEFTILAPSIKKAFNQTFKRNINLIVGVKDSGKTTLVRSMLYTLGCDVKGFDFIDKYPSNIYIIDFNIDDDKFILIRKRIKDGRGKNFFKIIKNNIEIFTFFDTSNYKEFLNKIMKIEVVTRGKDKTETTLYPNHIFLPFYTDQDNSWQNYLSGTFNGIVFIDNYKKVILEYFTGARPNEYYGLQLEKTNLVNQLDDLNALIKSKELIIKENINNIKIIENIDVEDFKKQYDFFLKMYNNILNSEHELKKELNEKIYKKNSYLDIKSKVTQSIDSFIESELTNTCPNCEQIIHNIMEDNYKLYQAKENLINERDKLNMYLKDIESEISITLKELNNLKEEDQSLKSKLDTTAKLVNLNDRADSYALNRVNSKLENEIDKLRIERDKKNESLEITKKELSELNKYDVSTKYQELMISSFIELGVPFSYNNYYTSNLESVKISLSGATKVQAYIAQYLSIYQMITNNDKCITIPMFIDTFLKDDFNLQEIQKTTKYIFNTLIDKEQSFIFIADNEQTLDSVKNYNINKIFLDAPSSILTDGYEKNYTKYEEYM